ncbi:MAG: cell division protease FtsH, partial [Thermoleophilaceae bacterium]|nr:cell division protease FtsH [Thermoleophilaceae bacterium]
LVCENEQWRDYMFNQRAPEPRSAYPRWYSRAAGIVNQGMFPGMGGMGGGLALNQLLVTMDGVDSPPFMRRFLTSKVNSILDAIYVVPRRVGKNGGRLVGALLILGAGFLLLDHIVSLAGSTPPLKGLTAASHIWTSFFLLFDVLLIWSGISMWRQASSEGTLSLRMPTARPTGNQIYFIGATNVPIENLDPALTRPGRMGRHVWFRTPTKEDRKDIFDLYLDRVAHDPELDTPERRDEIARITNGYSPAMIVQICSMALTNAHHEGLLAFTWKHLVDGMTAIESGTAVGVQYVEHEKRATAIHEAGHAAAAHIYRPDLESSRLSVRMRGRSLGHHQSFQREERFSEWQNEAMGGLVHILGARAAERVFYNENTNGVGGDLQSATQDAAWMVGTSGMGPQYIDLKGAKFDDETEEQTRERIMKRFEKIGLTLMNRTRGSADFGGDPVASVLQDPYKRAAAAQILGQAYVTAENFIAANRKAVEDIAEAVIEKGELYGDDLVGLLDRQNLKKPELDWTKEETWPRI